MRRLFVALSAAVIGVGALGASQPYGDPTTTIELRVWQGIEDRTDIAIGARATDGSWGALGMVPLPLDDGFRPHGDYRYGQTTLEVPLTSAVPVGVEVRVWQAVRVTSLIYVSARGVGGSWALLGTVRLRLDHGIRPDLGYRYRRHAHRGGAAGAAGRHDRRARNAVGLRRRRGVRCALRESPRGRASWAWTSISDGSVVVVNYYNPAVRRVAPDGTVTTIAGNNGRGLRDGSADIAQFWGPTSVAIAPDGAIYVARPASTAASAG